MTDRTPESTTALALAAFATEAAGIITVELIKAQVITVETGLKIAHRGDKLSAQMDQDHGAQMKRIVTEIRAAIPTLNKIGIAEPHVRTAYDRAKM